MVLQFPGSVGAIAYSGTWFLTGSVETQPFMLLNDVSNRVEWNPLFIVHDVMDPVVQYHELTGLHAPQGHDGQHQRGPRTAERLLRPPVSMGQALHDVTELTSSEVKTLDVS